MLKTNVLTVKQHPEQTGDPRAQELSTKIAKMRSEGTKTIWELFPTVDDRVRRKHKKAQLFGHHDWWHARRVGDVARMVALDAWGDQHTSHLAGLAGLSHNADRILQKERNVGRREVPPDDVADLVARWLRGILNGSDKYAVVDAVLKHDGRNSSEDSRTLIGLMDGDRVVNLSVDLFPRSGQYYHDLPVVDYELLLDDPNATYRDPRSVLKDIAYSLEWADGQSPVGCRTPLGLAMAQSRAALFRGFFSALEEQLHQDGVRPRR